VEKSKGKMLTDLCFGFEEKITNERDKQDAPTEEQEVHNHPWG
jgi:hypothetical protein